MKEQNPKGRTETTEQEEVIRCMTCGSIIGYYGPGSNGKMKCPTCKDDFRLDFRKESPTLMRIPRRMKAKAAT